MPLRVSDTGVVGIQRHIALNAGRVDTAMQRLADGTRINRAADDAAGLQLSESLDTQVRGAAKALDNIETGINMLNYLDGAYQSLIDGLQRIRELLVQTANDTYSPQQRDAIDAEINQVIADLYQIRDKTEFNGISLLSPGSVPANIFIQVGPNDGATDRLDIRSAIWNFPAGAAPTVNINDGNTARVLLGVIDNNLASLAQSRGILGAFVNRLEGAAHNLRLFSENTAASRSRVKDADVAAESANLIQSQILQQASVAMLAQARQSSSQAIRLLMG